MTKWQKERVRRRPNRRETCQVRSASTAASGFEENWLTWTLLEGGHHTLHGFLRGQVRLSFPLRGHLSASEHACVLVQSSGSLSPSRPWPPSRKAQGLYSSMLYSQGRCCRDGRVLFRCVVYFFFKGLSVLPSVRGRWANFETFSAFTMRPRTFSWEIPVHPVFRYQRADMD